MMKKWNKATTAALLTAFVMTGAFPAQAEEATKPVTTQTEPASTEPAPTKPVPIELTVPAGMIQKDQAIAKARKALGGLKDLPYAEAHYTDYLDYFVNGPSWSVHFSAVDPNDSKANEEARKKGPQRSVSAYLNAKTGELMQFQDQNPAWTGMETPEKGQAVRAADAFLKNVLSPEQIAKLSKGDAFGGRSGGGYTDEDGTEYLWQSSDVQYVEMVNGIPFTSNTIQVSVDQYGHVVGYRKQFRFDSFKLPKPEGILSKDVATIELAKRASMELQYQTRTYVENEYGGLESKDNPVLAYQANGMTQIDAFTGKPADFGYAEIDTGEPTKHKLKGEGKVPTAKTKEEAAKVVSEVLGIDMSGLIYEPPTKSPFDKVDENTPLYFSWHEDFAKRPQDATKWNPLYVSATFDAKTGKLLQLYRNGNEGKKPVFTLEEGKQMALDLLKKYVPEGEQELMLTASHDSTIPFAPPSWFDESKSDRQRYETGATYSYFFAPTYQGIVVSDLNYSVEMNAQTGSLISLRLPDKYDVKLPDNKDVADPEVVEATFIWNHPLTLEYQWHEFDNQQAPQGMLVYKLSERSEGNTYIDAFKGYEIRN